MKALPFAVATFLVLLTPAWLIATRTYHLASSDAVVEAQGDVEVTVAVTSATPGCRRWKSRTPAPTTMWISFRKLC